MANETIEYILPQIQSGFLFEDFAKDFTAAIDGVDFIPVGGIHDRGIDGLEFTYSPDSIRKKIYQFSIEKDAKAKIRKTCKVLRENRIDAQRIIYSTNIVVDEQDKIIDEMFDTYNSHVQIRDIRWFSANVLKSSHTLAVYQSFEERNVHIFSKPTVGFELINVKDPRIYVYVRQQLESPEYTATLDQLLVDTLIFLALDDTDPNKEIFHNKAEIIELITALTNFDQLWLNNIVSERLHILSSKPLRKIKHHQNIDAYVLPYETRLVIQDRQIQDQNLHKHFSETTLSLLEDKLSVQSVVVQRPQKLLEEVFHRLFSQQGLEFSQFVTTGDGDLSVDKSLRHLVSEVVGDSSVIPKNRQIVKTALLDTIREIIYRGSDEQLEFLRCLADTYRMLFLLQIDPQLAQYFEVMANKLHIYVDTSILIPAMSEYFLDLNNRRYTNLLICARDAGIDLVVNHTIVSELAAHMRSVQRIFLDNYANQEDLYDHEEALVYIPEILIRAYFYAKMAGKVVSFEEFYEYFITWNSTNPFTELVDWLRDAFGARYEEFKTLGLKIDATEEEHLFQELTKYKASEAQARNDAKQLLMIYALREKNQETGNSGIFGYSTWWLTSDFNSQIAFRKITASRHHMTPYIRADFLYNYIVLAPSKARAGEIYRKVFPTLLGVNISFHVPIQLCEIIQSNLKAHKQIVDTPRFRAQLRNLTDQLKSNPDAWNRERIESWFSERAKEIKASQNNSI